MAAKLLLTGGLTFLTMIVSELILAFIFSQLNDVYQFSPEKLTMHDVGNEIGSMLIYAAILGLLCLIGSEEKNLPQAKMSMADAASMLLVIGIFVRSVFIVFAGVLIAKLVIGEYKNRTITVMFTSISSIVYIPLSLAAVGLFFSFLAVRRIEKIDVF
ncbi:hypothetical protein DT075_36870 [Bacillus licheniformis]|nr:hypothetical protein DT075_36870 [Bacillus licheniformis]